MERDAIEQEESAFYEVKLDVFEGPMDLLLYLIRKDELDIYDIPIAHITTQYLGFCNTFTNSTSNRPATSSSWRPPCCGSSRR